MIYIIIIRVFCPRAGPSLQVQEPRLQLCRRQVFHCKLSNQGCSFARDWVGAVASHCFPHPTLSIASEQTLKGMKKFQRHPRGGQESGFSQLGPLDFTKIHHRGSMRVFDQIRDPEIPITLLLTDTVTELSSKMFKFFGLYNLKISL